ncbi:MAG: TlpA family protein disulfide reductase [Leptospirillum sp.]
MTDRNRKLPIIFPRVMQTLLLLLLLFLLSGTLPGGRLVEARAAVQDVPDSGLLQKMGFIVFDDRERAPEIQAPVISGKPVDLASFKGDWVLLNFWATWCVPCRTEIPTLVRLENHMNGRKFVLVSVAMDHDPAKIRAFLRKMPVDYPVLLGRKGKVDERYVGMGLPQTYLIDPSGYLVGKAAGSRDWSGSLAYRLFDSLPGSKATDPAIAPGAAPKDPS